MNHAARSSLLTCGLVCALFAGACADANPRFTRGSHVLIEPVAVGDRLAYIDHDQSRAVLVDSLGKHAPNSVALPVAPARAVPREGEHREALILCEGRLGAADAESAPSALAVLGEDGAVRVYETGSDPFDIVQQSDDGKYVALLRAQSGDRLIKNVNQLALVDLERELGDAGALSFVSVNEPPRKVVFSEGLKLDGKERRLAVVLSANAITLVDLEHPEQRPTIIDLSHDAALSVWPDQVLFDPLAARIYVRGSSDDVFVLRLSARTAEQGRHDFGVAIDIVAGGRTPTDVELYQLAGESRLLIIAEGSHQAVSVEPGTSRTTAVALPRGLDHAFIFQREAEDSPSALIWDSTGTTLVELKLTDLDTNLGRNLTLLAPLLRPVAQVVPLDDQQRVVFLHNRGGLSIVDPVHGSVTPLAATQRLDNGLLDLESNRLWLAPPGQLRVADVGVLDGQTRELELDERVASIVLMPWAKKLAVRHDSAIGYVTFVDMQEPARETSRSARGFLFTGLLD